MHFGTKSYLKSTRNHTAKHALCIVIIQVLPNYNYNYYVYLFNQNKFIEIISAIKYKS